MHTFVLVQFWLSCVAVLGSLVYLMGEHPRIPSPWSVGADCAKFIIAIAFFVWEAWLLWGGAA